MNRFSPVVCFFHNITPPNNSVAIRNLTDKTDTGPAPSANIKLPVTSRVDQANTAAVIAKNPFKNLNIENYRYAQLHKNIKPHTNILKSSLNDDLTQLTTDISNNIFTEIDLKSTIDNWEFSNSDSFFRVSSLVKRSSISINLDNFKETSLFLNISNIPKNITIKKKDPQLKTLILLNYNNDDEIPKSIFFDIAENTNLEIIQYDISNHKSFLYFEVRQANNSNFNFVSFQSNNTHIRNEFFSYLGEKCNFELSGLNFNNFGVNDNYSFIQHAKPSSSSREVFKSIVNNGAITNFQGKIYVDSIAQKTDGYQMSRSLLLDNISKANNKPELEIYADDVKCSHGSTVSKIDQDQIFYFNSRGISKEVANLLLQKAFIIETLDTIHAKDIKDFSIKLLDNLLS